MPRLIFDGHRMTSATAEEVADRLEHIAKQVREGYTSGDAGGSGWWSLEWWSMEAVKDD